MRIGIFTDTYPPYINGVSTSVVMLEKALKKQNHQVYIVTVNPNNLSLCYEEDGHVIRLPGIPTGIYDYRLTEVYPLRVIRKIKKWNLDVIHSHTEFGVGTFARILSKQWNIPLVHTYHTMYEDYVHYITKGYFLGPSKKIVEYLTKFYCDKTATELIVPTQKAYDLFKNKYKVNRNVHIIPTGIEIERFYKENFSYKQIEALRKKLGLTTSDFVILFVGRLGEEKSVDVLIEGQFLLLKKNPHAKLLIVGDGPDKEKYQKLAHRLKLDSSVLFVGKVPWEEVPIYYQLAHVFATASKTETQGLTVLEALASSLVVLCAQDEAYQTTITEDLNGLYFKNKKEYVKKIMSLMENKEKLEWMQKEARISAEPHSSKYFGQSVVQVYKAAIREVHPSKTFFGRLKNIVKRGFYEK